MAADSIHTVFISSTFDDLREERAEVQKAVLRLGCLPIGMELFPSADSDAWEFIKGEIERSDYYVLIIGGRYGSLAPDGLSYTQKEYIYARELKKPSLVFVRSSSAAVPEDKREQDDEKRKKLREFVKELNGSRLAQRFDNCDQLGRDAYFSLTKLRESKPAPGYVRAGKDVISGSSFESQLRELSRKNRELQKQYLIAQADLNELKAEHIRTLTQMGKAEADVAASRLEKSLVEEIKGGSQRFRSTAEIEDIETCPPEISDSERELFEKVICEGQKISRLGPDVKLGHIFLSIAEGIKAGMGSVVFQSSQIAFIIVDRMCAILRYRPLRNAKSQLSTAIMSAMALQLLSPYVAGGILTPLGESRYEYFKMVYQFRRRHKS